MSRMPGDSGENVGQPDLRTEAVELGGDGPAVLQHSCHGPAPGEVSLAVAPGAHAVLMVDQAGFLLLSPTDQV